MLGILQLKMWMIVTNANLDFTNAAREILDFWFGTGEVLGKSRPEWFRKDAGFDEEIRTRFLGVYETVVQTTAAPFAHWIEQPYAGLALIVLLDQFPRNMFRQDTRAFATDSLARQVTRQMLAQGFDVSMWAVERQFIYLPLEHSESMADQTQSIRLFNTLSVFPETRDLHRWAEKHRVVIERFGRFPHRNLALGRDSTAEEIVFLTQPCSGF